MRTATEHLQARWCSSASTVVCGLICAALAAACADAPVTAPSLSRSAPDVRYIMQPIGTLTRTGVSIAEAINDGGAIVGSATPAGGAYPVDLHAFRHQNNVMTDLGTLPGHSQSAAFDINNKGYVAGSSASGWQTRAVLWRPDNSIIDLGHLDAAGRTEAYGINERLTVVGYSERLIAATITKTEAFRWTPAGGFQALGAQFDYSIAHDVNEDGYIAGLAGKVGEVHAVIWRPDGSVIDLGKMNGSWAHALAINDGKVVVGEGETISIDVHAFDWKPGYAALHDLGPNYYSARDVANTGRIVGSLRGTPDAFTLRAGVTTVLPRMSDGAGAYGVNTCGTVVGYSSEVGGKLQAVRWIQDGGLCDVP